MSQQEADVAIDHMAAALKTLQWVERNREALAAIKTT
jgi:post-segregation antitoxin (ccd killing protein)